MTLNGINPTVKIENPLGTAKKLHKMITKMNCQHCNKSRATVHITDTVPERKERHLCEDCAEKEGVIIKPNQHTTNEILQQFIKQKIGLGLTENVVCPQCGLSFQEFQVKGQLGCPHDYEVFKAQLMPLIERAHEGGTKHVGKKPGGGTPPQNLHTGLLKLRRELQDAIQQENYELAARVRDQIRNLEQQ